MTKRNSNFSVFSHLRMLLKLFPVRDSVAFRMAVAARLEADEATGEVFPSQGRSPRERLEDTACIERAASIKEAMSTIKKAGLIRGERQYKNGHRQGGSDRLVLDWSKWEDACLELNSAQWGSVSLNEPQAPSVPLSEPQGGTLSETQGGTLSETQQEIRKTAIVTATVTSTKNSPLAGKTSNTPKAPSAGTLDLKRNAGHGLQMQEPEVVLPTDGIPWIAQTKMASHYAQAVWFDRRAGKLWLVHDERGRAFYRSLRDDGYAIDEIKAAMTTACKAAPRTPAKGGGLEALVRTYCGYAQDRRRGSGAPEMAFAGRRPFQP